MFLKGSTEYDEQVGISTRSGRPGRDHFLVESNQ